ncbi:MAG TPA: hypothetical protein VF397_17140 [Pyrinomonadaceae bacterium]
MLYVLISILIMAALLDKALRRGRIDLLLLEMRFKFFALRDELRDGVVTGTLPENKWFEYLDTSITKAIDLLPTITAWETVALVLRYKNDPTVQHAQTTLLAALSEQENQKLNEVYIKFVLCIVEVLFRRHVGIRYGMKGLAKVVVSTRGFVRTAAKMITVAPETSTLTQYAQ